jgi:hypothetical protein
MSKLKTIDICAEFGYEIACSIPYAYWNETILLFL